MSEKKPNLNLSDGLYPDPFRDLSEEEIEDDPELEKLLRDLHNSRLPEEDEDYDKNLGIDFNSLLC